MWVSRRNRPGDVEVDAKTVAEPSHAVESSLWPLTLGLGLLLVANGFVLGLWLLVPGAALVLRGLVGVFTERPSPTRYRTYAEITPSPAGAVDQQLGVAGPQRRIERQGGSRHKDIRVGHGMVGFDPPRL